MGTFDEFRKKLLGKPGEKEPTAVDRPGKPSSSAKEVERRESNFDRIPAEHRAAVRHLAKINHEYHLKNFPDFKDFLEAFCGAWLEQKKGFEEETERLGFASIPPGTKPSELNKRLLAFLTQRGSWILVGPGGFKKDGPGASASYTKVELREDSQASGDQEQGYVFARTPRVGEGLVGLQLPSGPGKHSEYGAGEHVPGIPTDYSPLISTMMREIEEGESVAGLMGLTNEAVTERSTRILSEARLLPGTTKKDK